MSWLKKLIPSRIRTTAKKRRDVPEGVWTKCNACGAVLYRAELERNILVCGKCDHHHRMPARKRLEIFLDEGLLEEIGSEVKSSDRLKFRDSQRYRDRLLASQKKTGEGDGLVAFYGKLHGMPIVAAAFDFSFMGGSMGSTVGERFVQAVNSAVEHHVPFVCFASSGGARMQEGLISLMQMAKTSAVLTKLAEKQLPYIAILCDPTMGGVSASLAMLGDIILAEPKALIGFAGPRVIQQTVRETLPEGFQRSEFLLEHGAIDQIVDRREMRNHVANLIAKLINHPPIAKEVEQAA